MDRQRLWALTRKEIIQILRDRRFIMLFLGLAFVQLFVYGYSASKTVYNLPLAVVDQSQSTRSRDFVEALVNSQYFKPTMYLESQADVLQAIDRGEVKAGVVIPADFATNSMVPANVLFVLDGSDQFAVRSAYGAANAVAPLFYGSLFQWFGAPVPFFVGGLILLVLWVLAPKMLK